MSWYRADPAALVTPQLLAYLASAAGTRVDELPQSTGPLLTQLFELTAGLPFTDQRPTAGTRTATARRLLQEAVGHALTPVGGSRLVPLGWRFDEAAPPATTVAGARSVRIVPRVAVNQANASDIAGLPGIGPGLAARVVDERRHSGPFTGIRDLATRVDGVSDEGARRLYALVRFDFPDAAAPLAPGSGDGVRDDFADLIATRAGATSAERLLAALDLLVVRAADGRHPAAREIRHPIPPGKPPGEAADHVVLLSGRDYYEQLPMLIGAATDRIEVAMFHIALPGPNHPTARILDALAAARARGARVRVLVDRDRPDDPYRSVVINRPAIERLVGAGVTVRVDLPERLLHSKFLCLDDDRTIIGSHNWSAGSYFGFDDLSVLIESSAVCRQQRSRFDALWRTASPAPRRRRRRRN